MKNNADSLPPIPAKRYFNLSEAAQLANLELFQIQEWLQQDGSVLGKGAKTLTRLDVIKLRQLRHGIQDLFAKDYLDSKGRPVISADEARDSLKKMLVEIEDNLANLAG